MKPALTAVSEMIQPETKSPNWNTRKLFTTKEKGKTKRNYSSNFQNIKQKSFGDNHRKVQQK